VERHAFAIKVLMDFYPLPAVLSRHSNPAKFSKDDISFWVRWGKENLDGGTTARFFQ